MSDLDLRSENVLGSNCCQRKAQATREIRHRKPTGWQNVNKTSSTGFLLTRVRQCLLISLFLFQAIAFTAYMFYIPSNGSLYSLWSSRISGNSNRNILLKDWECSSSKNAPSWFDRNWRTVYTPTYHGYFIIPGDRMIESGIFHTSHVDSPLQEPQKTLAGKYLDKTCTELWARCLSAKQASSSGFECCRHVVCEAINYNIAEDKNFKSISNIGPNQLRARETQLPIHNTGDLEAQIPLVTPCSNLSPESRFWNRPKSKYSGYSCSKGFCDWVKTSTLKRCYRFNQMDSGAEATEIQYLNRTVDDFKFDAPLECNLCLPEEDKDGIEQHCIEVESREDNTLNVLFGVLGGIFGLAACWTIVMQGYKWWKRNHPRQQPHRHKFASMLTNKNLDGVIDVESIPKFGANPMQIIMGRSKVNNSRNGSTELTTLSTRSHVSSSGLHNGGAVHPVQRHPLDSQPEAFEQENSPSRNQDDRPRFWTLPIPYGFRSPTIKWLHTVGSDRHEISPRSLSNQTGRFSSHTIARTAKRVPVLQPASPYQKHELSQSQAGTTVRQRVSSSNDGTQSFSMLEIMSSSG